MKPVFLFLLLTTVFVNAAPAQTNPKGNTVIQKEMEEMRKKAEQQINKVLDQLSPEERKRAEEAMAKGKSDIANSKASGKMNSLPDVHTAIPQKQTAILAQLPVISSAAQYGVYLNKMLAQTKTSIPKNIRDEVESLLSKNSSDKIKLNNLAPALLLSKNPKAAVYAALRASETYKDELLLQNNLAVILHQTGYPQYALPVLEFLLIENPLPIIYNNAGQCLLSLGETQKAGAYFAACLRADPNNHEAHCGTALILINHGKIPQAVPHIEKAMKTGYSPVLDKLVNAHNINLDFDKMKPAVPEYFNPNKYPPPHAAKTLKDIKQVLAERQEIEDLMYAWGEKQGETDEKNAEKMSKETVAQMNRRMQGISGNQPFSKKALFMLAQLGKEVLKMQTTGFNSFNPKEIAEAKVMHETLQANIRQQYEENRFESTFEECVMLRKETERYLQESAAFFDSKVQKTVFRYYDITNQQLYWNKFLLNTDGYEQMFYGAAHELFFHLNEYKKYQELTHPEWVLNNCEKILANPPKKTVAIEEKPDPDCPFRIKVNLGIADGKIDCKGWEIEGGELVVLGIQKDYKTGELTVAFGVGANIGLGLGGLGAKGQMFFKFDSDYAPADCGMVFEAGAEAAAGPVVIEEKATATVGMVSGIHVTGVAAGQETAIFTLTP